MAKQKKNDNTEIVSFRVNKDESPKNLINKLCERYKKTNGEVFVEICKEYFKNRLQFQNPIKLENPVYFKIEDAFKESSDSLLNANIEATTKKPVQNIINYCRLDEIPTNLDTYNYKLKSYCKHDKANEHCGFTYYYYKDADGDVYLFFLYVEYVEKDGTDPLVKVEFLTWSALQSKLYLFAEKHTLDSLFNEVDYMQSEITKIEDTENIQVSWTTKNGKPYTRIIDETDEVSDKDQLINGVMINPKKTNQEILKVFDNCNTLIIQDSEHDDIVCDFMKSIRTDEDGKVTFEYPFKDSFYFKVDGLNTENNFKEYAYLIYNMETCYKDEYGIRLFGTLLDNIILLEDEKYNKS